MILVSLYDKVTEEFSSPTVAVNKAHAVKMIQQSVKECPVDKKSYFEDKAVFVLGDFVLETGKITPIEPECIYEIILDKEEK